MEWKRPADAALLGEDAHAAKHAAEMSAMLDEWPQKHVKRFRLSCGKAAWLWLTAEGLLTCSAVAPWDDIFAADYVLAETFFANVEWPAAWRTKGREGLTKGQRAWAPKVERDKIYEEWCCGSLEGGRVVLCRVAAIGEAGELVAVQTREDGPSVPVVAHPARKWWPMDKWPLGLRAMWDEERDSVHNYRLFCMMAANAQASAEGLPAGRKRKGAVKPPPVVPSKTSVQADPKDADFRRRMDAKRIELGLPAFTDAEWQAFRSA